MKMSKLKTESELAEQYFNHWAKDYDIAFEGGKEDHLLQKTINRLFREKTFKMRDRHLKNLLKKINVQGKKVLDLGCGSGQLSILAAQNAAQVTGWDISPRIVDICQKKAQKMKLKNAKFAVKDVTQ